ncbi:MAG: hypothetical protein PUB97_09480 [Ruminococcus sp.]|nr:hypothetical protein [Ruminococcus sp.]
MKRYVVFSLSILMLATMTACGVQPAVSSSPSSEESFTVCTTDQKIPEQEDKNPEVTKDTEQTSEQTSVQTIDPDLAYSELVDRFRALVSDPFGQDGDNPGEMGVLEAARIAGDNAVYEMGYLIEDLSGDGIPELAVGELHGMTNALYTLVDGKPELVFEGWYRSSYVYKGNGHFYYYGANSAAENGKGLFYLSEDGTGLECERFLFTGLNEDGNIDVYYNETGSWDPAESEKSDMTAEDFWAMDPAGEPLPLTPFSEMGSQSAIESEFPVSVQYLMEAGNEDYDWVTLYDGSDACCILITSDSLVSNLNIWNLFVEDVADDGTVTCSTTMAGDDCHWDTVTSDTSIAIKLIFPGDLPAYGISYEDQHGVLRCFAIEVSGDDGSLLLREADPDESEFILRAEW